MTQLPAFFDLTRWVIILFSLTGLGIGIWVLIQLAEKKEMLREIARKEERRIECLRLKATETPRDPNEETHRG